jgi:hypothetical protein
MEKLAVAPTVEIVGQGSNAHFHLLLDPTGCQVSRKSLWEDPVWYLDGRGPTSIYWSFDLPDGTCFTDPRHARLLSFFKRFLWSVMVDCRDGYAWSPHALAVRHTGIRRVVRWMVQRSHFNFATMDADAFNQFKEDLLVWLEEENVHADDSVLVEDQEAIDAEDFPEVTADANGSEVSFYTALKTSFTVWQRLWQQSGALVEAGIPTMPMDPLAGRSPHALAAEITAYVAKNISPLPDEVALPIMGEAHRWLGVRADDVIRLHEIYMACLGELGDLGVEDINGEQAARLGFSFSVEPGSAEPWHPPLNPVKVTFERSDQAFGFQYYYRVPTTTVRNLVDKVIGACAVVIQSETGMRISELASIPGGFDTQRGEHNAVEVRLSKTGLNELFFIKSTLYKTVKAPKTEEWLAGSRPVGSSFMPGPIRAVYVLEALFEPWRLLSTDSAVHDALFVVTSNGGGGLSRKSTSFAPDKTYNIRNRQKQFIEDCVDLGNLPDSSRLGEELVPYRTSKGCCIKTHQWRKTFAMYVVRTDPRMIPAISLQFKHLSVAMTENAYISKDPTLMREYSTQQARAAAAFMYRTVTGKDPVAGRIAKLIDEWATEILAKVNGMNSLEAIYTLQHMCEERDIRAFSSPHGKCFIRLIPAEARCHQRAGTAHWSLRRPNFDYREPDVCDGCPCFGVDADHIPFWQDRYVEYQTAWLAAQSQGLQAGFRVVQERAAKSANMLRNLAVELPSIKEVNTCRRDALKRP